MHLKAEVLKKKVNYHKKIRIDKQLIIEKYLRKRVR